jgi:hypothetical protein
MCLILKERNNMATDAEKVKMYREKAKDTSIPQEVRNTYLDRANELERKAFEDTKKAPTPPVKLAMGGMPVRGSRTATNQAKKMMGGGYAMPMQTPMMSKGGAMKMNKGGYANCGASMAPAQKGKK